MKRLSIIVPIYNVEPYVERCIRSLEDQDIPQDSYEIICINDGSPDKSHDVVVRLQGEFGNILLIDQENQGVSRARNNGMEVATGEYLMMVDPDDYLKPGVLKERLDIMDEHQLDVGLMGYTILNEAGEEVYHYDPLHESSNFMAGVDLLNKFWREETGTEERDPHRSVSMFFRREFLKAHELRYLQNVPYLEDGELMARIMCLAKRVTFMNGQVYMRTTRPGSATHSPLYYSERGRDGFIKAAHNLHQFKLEHCRNKAEMDFINDSIVHFTIMSITSLEIKHYPKNYSKLHKALKKGPLKKLEPEGCSSWYKKMGRYYNRSIHCFYLYWICYKIREAIKIELEYYFLKLKRRKTV
ncbi:MAG: glycosyltransferase [Bacteroidales bacterium]|nr:glycosyltransferase [Bacteroidales bacterium]